MSNETAELKDMKCEICNKATCRFVRDHDHKTGMIRGILCELCNNYIFIYEKVTETNGKFDEQKVNTRVRTWFRSNHDLIEKYLSKPITGVDYAWALKKPIWKFEGSYRRIEDVNPDKS
jgi:hypothetical protein